MNKISHMYIMSCKIVYRKLKAPFEIYYYYYYYYRVEVMYRRKYVCILMISYNTLRFIKTVPLVSIPENFFHRESIHVFDQKHVSTEAASSDALKHI